MAQINRTGSGRVMGNKVGRMPTAGVRASTSGLTTEQKAERKRDTQKAYEVWRSEREERKARRYDARAAQRNNGL